MQKSIAVQLTLFILAVLIAFVPVLLRELGLRDYGGDWVLYMFGAGIILMILSGALIFVGKEDKTEVAIRDLREQLGKLDNLDEIITLLRQLLAKTENGSNEDSKPDNRT